MTTVASISEKSIAHVAILRALPGIGDLLCAIPALRALRMALPRARISVIGLPAMAPLVRRFPNYIDDLLELPGFPGLPESPFDARSFAAFLSAVQQPPLDLALQMHGSGHFVNVLVELLGARFTAGYYPAGSYCPDEQCFLPYPEDLHEIHRNLQLVESLGAPAQGDYLEFPIAAIDRAQLAATGGVKALARGQYACVHPGAKNPARRWPAERFAEVARALQERGLQVVLTGSIGETEIAREIAARLAGRVLDLTGQTSLGALAALVEGAACVICNDTGVSHLAAALNVPSVVIFHGGPTARSDPPRWAPLDLQRHRVAAPFEMQGCDAAPAARGADVTSTSALPFTPVSADRVVALADDLLQKREQACVQ